MMTGSIKMIEENSRGYTRAATALQKMALDGNTLHFRKRTKCFPRVSDQQRPVHEFGNHYLAGTLTLRQTLDQGV